MLMIAVGVALVLLLLVLLVMKQQTAGRLAMNGRDASAAKEAAHDVSGDADVSSESSGDFRDDASGEDSTTSDSASGAGQSTDAAATATEQMRRDIPPELVAPIATGRPDTPQAATGLDPSRERSTTTHRLNTGGATTSLAPGADNPLVAPPGITSVVYVVDCSSSMGNGRFERVVAALVDAVERLEPTQQFAVFLFNSEAHPINGGVLQFPSPANISHLREQLDRASVTGGTDPTSAIRIALRLDPQAIVVLSDGEFMPTVVDQITLLNQSNSPPIQINCLGLASDIRTLRELAQRNGPGSYAEAK